MPIGNIGRTTYARNIHTLNVRLVSAVLLLPDPKDWLPEDHLAYRLIDVVSELDMSEFLGGYSADGRGAPAYSPVLMVSLLLYGWCRHVYSWRKLAALCLEDTGARVIVADNQPGLAA